MTGLDLSSKRSRPRPNPLDVALVVAAVLGLAWVLRAFWVSEDDLQRAQRDRGRAQTQSAELAAKVRGLEGRSDPRQETRAARKSLAAEAPPGEVVRALSALLPPDVRLLDLSLTYDQAVSLDMRVVARRPVAYDLFLDRLHGSERFRSVVPGPESHDGEVSATVRAEYKGEAFPP
jgi:Tfp pilus assembly protein PilN